MSIERKREPEYVCGHDQAEDTDWNREQFSFMTMKIDLGTSFHPPPPWNKHEKQEEDEWIRFERIHSVKFAFFGSRKRKRKNGQFSISFSYPHSGFTLCQFHILTPSTTIFWRSPTAEQSSFFKFEQNDTTEVAGWGCIVHYMDSRRPTMERRSRTQIANWLFFFFSMLSFWLRSNLSLTTWCLFCSHLIFHFCLPKKLLESSYVHLHTIIHS